MRVTDDDLANGEGVFSAREDEVTDQSPRPHCFATDKAAVFIAEVSEEPLIFRVFCAGAVVGVLL